VSCPEIIPSHRIGTYLASHHLTETPSTEK
jgi:hypothetical protein